MSGKKIRAGYVLVNMEKNPTGINRYSQEILKNLLNHEEISMEILGENFIVPGKIRERYGLYTRLQGDIRRQKEIWAAAVMDRLDIVHSFYHPVPDKKGVVKILTIHDLSPLANEEWFADKKSYRYFNENIRHSAETADAVIAVSEATKREILHFFHIPENKIRVIYEGLNCHQAGEEHPLDVHDKWGIEGEYILSVGTLQPRKNLVSLIKAFCIYKGRHRASDVKLVLTGQRGWSYNAIFDEAEAGKYVNDIIFTGYVSDEDLSHLYKNALAFAYVSFYEGFGLPILEAMAHGKAVLSSNTTSMPEVGGDAVVYCNPYDLESICDGLTCLIEDIGLRNGLEQKAELQAAKFSYKKAAEEICDLYKEFV